MSDCISRQAAIDAIDGLFIHEVESDADETWNKAIEWASNKIKCFLPSTQPDWGKHVGDGRPLADSEVIPRLQDIKAQIGGSYAIDRAIEVLEGLSSTQPERKKGKWITQEFGSWAECSECHELYDIPIACSNFCPNCGAKMDGKGEDNEVN